MKRIARWISALLGLLILAVLILIAFNWKSDIPLSGLKAKYANQHSRFLNIDGMPVHYRDEGNRQDTLPPIVLIHGTGASLHTWDGWVEALQDQHRIIRLDLPAYGLTGPNDSGDYSLDFYAGFLLKFLDSLDVDQVIIGGNSLGGGVAWMTALRAPERVSGLILVDASGYPVTSQSRPLAFRVATWPLVSQLFRYVTPRSVIEQSVRNVYADKSLVSEALIDRYHDLARRPGNRQAFLDRVKGESSRSEAWRKITSLEQPALILWGAQDELIPVSAARRFHQDLPNDTLVILDGLGHVPMEEGPLRTVAAVKDFLEKWY